jgi:hypothetical protein
MMSDGTPDIRELRKYILTQPFLTTAISRLDPRATKEVRRIAQDSGLGAGSGVLVRLTVPSP